MITFFTIPKPFQGRTGVIQRNAVGSWTRVDSGAQVLLLGDDEGTAEAADDLGVEHVPELACNENGTPLLDGAFASARARARHDVLCFANADIVLLGDFAAAVARVRRSARPFLIVGESWDTRIDAPLTFDAGWEERVRVLPGRKRGAGALDYFAFTKGLFTSIPPFVVGRPAFDNWLVWRACEDGALVVDATPSVRSIHQSHDYGHVGGGFEETRRGEEARTNWELIGSKRRIYTRYDATHVLTRNGLRRNLGATLRAKERTRKAIWKLRHGQLLPARMP